MTNDMTKGAITPLLIRFTIPLVLGNLFQLTYNAADSIIVGKFVGEEALAAVGTSNPLMTLAILFINGMCLGAGILVSTAFGAGNTQLMERQVSTTAIAGTVFSLAFSALCVILATPLLQLMQVPADILPIAASYLRIVFAGLIFTFFYNFLAATMRALGDSKSALYFLMISSVLNIGGDLFFVQVLNWGSNGCALSTVVSEALCCVLCVLYIRWKVPILQLGRRWLVFDGKLLRKTVSYGWASAMTTLMAQNRGAGKHDRVKQGFHCGMRIEAAYGVLIAVVCFAGAPFIMKLFVTDPEVVHLGVRFLRTVSLFYLMPAFTNGIQGFFRGIGDLKVTLVSSTFNMVFRVAAAAVFVLVWKMEIEALPYSYAVGWVVMLLYELPMLVRYLRSHGDEL